MTGVIGLNIAIDKYLSGSYGKTKEWKHAKLSGNRKKRSKTVQYPIKTANDNKANNKILKAVRTNNTHMLDRSCKKAVCEKRGHNRRSVKIPLSHKLHKIYNRQYSGKII